MAQPRAAGGAQPHAHNDDKGSSPQAVAERKRLIELGEASLAAGDIDGARRAYEQAANMAHAADIELGILRTQMQAGEYRQALAFAAHTAGVHLDEVDGAVFYAWLLNLGAQELVAEQTLKRAEARAPDDAFVQAARASMRSGEMLPSAVLRQGPARMAPYASGAVPATPACMVGSALLLADGRHALVPRAALPASGAVWLRNGLGQTVAAGLHPIEPALAASRPQQGLPLTEPSQGGDLVGHDLVDELVVLTLAAPLPTAGGEIVPPRDAFAGSPAFAIDYPLDGQGRPAWPLMRPGFLAAATAGSGGAHILGVTLPGLGPRGGPVYDQSGRLVGVALGQAAHAMPGERPARKLDLFVPVGALQRRFGEGFGAPTPELRRSPVGADEIYERALKTTLQVLAAAP